MKTKGSEKRRTNSLSCSPVFWDSSAAPPHKEHMTSDVQVWWKEHRRLQRKTWETAIPCNVDFSLKPLLFQAEIQMAAAAGLPNSHGSVWTALLVWGKGQNEAGGKRGQTWSLTPLRSLGLFCLTSFPALPASPQACKLYSPESTESSGNSMWFSLWNFSALFSSLGFFPRDQSI